MFPLRRAALWLLLCLVPTRSPVGARPDAAGTAEDRSVVRRALPAPAEAPGLAATGLGAAEEIEPYIERRYLVAPPAGQTLAGIAARVGGTVITPEGRSGYGILEADSLADIEATGASVSKLGQISGAGKKPSKTTSKTTTTTTTAPPRPPPTSWHLDAIGVPKDNLDWSEWVVAVLDSGVAYETSGRFVAAPGLTSVQWVEPLDLVELDGHPNDDHQHGTHIASLIAGKGSYPGVVPGVSLMPIKVLDGCNRGNEWALVEGIHHAIDGDADVINLSLSFPLGYTPSLALLDALSRAWEEDVVVVAASGNNAARELTWPAASRFTVAVGASGNRTGFLAQTSYSNVSPKLDVLAPGGELSVDRDGDGWIDGILAETIDRMDPSRVGLWFYQGTSQAAALVSGLAVRSLADGTPPQDIAATLQHSGGGYDALDAWITGTGADIANLGAALSTPVSRQDTWVGLLPYLADTAFGVRPSARVSVIDSEGAPIASATVLGTLYTSSGIQYPICTTDETGTCTLSVLDLWGSSSAWLFRVDSVVQDGVADRPSRALWTSDGAAVLLSALSATDGWDAIGIYWPGGTDTVLGKTLESWAVVDTGTGLLSSPLGVVFRPSHVTSLATAGTLTLDVDGTGLLSSPLGTTLSLRTLTFDLSGTGLLSSPLGFSSSYTLRLVGIDGSGLLSSPLGFHATMLYTGTSGTGLLSSPLGFGFSAPILLDRGTLLGSSEDEAELFTPLFDGGIDVGSAVVASGAVEVGVAASSSDTVASGATDAVPYTP